MLYKSYSKVTATYVWKGEEESEDNEADDARAGGHKVKMTPAGNLFSCSYNSRLTFGPFVHLFVLLKSSFAPALVLDWRKPQYLHIFQSLLQLTKPVIFGMFSLTFPVQNVTSVMLHLLEVISIICKVRFYCSQF